MKLGWGTLLLSGLLCFGAAGSVLGQHAAGAAHGGGGAPVSGGAPLSGGAHQHFDGRFSHNQYYYDHGYTVRRPPPGGLGELHGPDGGRYWFHGGHWYRWNGAGWAVWGAPIGLFVPFLPFYFTTVWWDGVPYYYANDTYYLWDDDQQQYEVVAPPDGIESGGTSRAPASNQLFVYPKNGQSAEQQDKDRYECHRSAVSQTGFDPTVSGGGVAPEDMAVKRNDYFRAQVACLEGRGYTVK
jgi:hypothetical protein